MTITEMSPNMLATSVGVSATVREPGTDIDVVVTLCMPCRITERVDLQRVHEHVSYVIADTFDVSCDHCSEALVSR